MQDSTTRQSQVKEIEFFDQFTERGGYDVFTEGGYDRLIGRMMELAGPARLGRGSRVIDLGCGSGAVIQRLQRRCEAECHGVDLSPKMVELARARFPAVTFREGDILDLGFYPDASFDLVIFSAVLHHFPRMEPALREGYRILKKGGCLLAFDPNRRNPAMWLYRDPASPFYSRVGVTENEALLRSEELQAALESEGFRSVEIEAVSGVSFRYIESRRARRLLPLYNAFERILGFMPFARRYGSFLISFAEK